MNKLAYEQGKEAKERGWDRLTPHGCRSISLFWLAGYDGIPFEQVQAFADKIVALSEE
jgi:hypothetical protein